MKITIAMDDTYTELDPEEIDKRGLASHWPGKGIDSQAMQLVVVTEAKKLIAQMQGARLHNAYSSMGKIHALADIPGLPSHYVDLFPEGLGYVTLDLLTQFCNTYAEQCENKQLPTDEVLGFGNPDTEEVYALIVPYLHSGAQARIGDYID